MWGKWLWSEKGVFIARLNEVTARDKGCETTGILFDKKPFIFWPLIVKMSLEKESFVEICAYILFFSIFSLP